MNSYNEITIKKSLTKNVGKLIKHIIITISSLLLLVSCESPTSYPNDYHTLEFDLRLPQDENGFYHLTIDRNNWQTLHRVSGSITNPNGYGIENFMVAWESDLYWYLGDTLGYIVNREFSLYQGKYVTRDTSYMIGFSGMEVPTSNQMSYSNAKGEINNMIGPVRSMIGDTLYLTADWFSGTATWGIVLD